MMVNKETDQAMPAWLKDRLDKWCLFILKTKERLREYLAEDYTDAWRKGLTAAVTIISEEIETLDDGERRGILETVRAKIVKLAPDEEFYDWL